MDLTELLLRPEGKTLEFKRDLSSPTGVLRTVVAFANTSGGAILIGVDDGTRAVRGVSDPLALEERVASFVRVTTARPSSASYPAFPGSCRLVQLALPEDVHHVLADRVPRDPLITAMVAEMVAAQQE